MATKIQIRRDTAANWTSNNPTPYAGEMCYETDTGYLKVGDGTTAWTSLGYVDTDTDTTYSVGDGGLTEINFTSAKDTKLSGIETNADVTDSTNVEAAGAVMESDTSTILMQFVVDEDNMSSDTDTKVPTQQSVKAYVDSQVATKDQLSELSGTTDDVTEGSTNLYYTDARVQAVSINDVSEDTTPQLGGNLDLNSNDITGTGDINITGDITATGSVNATLVGNLSYYAKASASISKGDVVMFNGAQGDHVLIVKADMSASGFIPEWVMGVAESNMSIGDFANVVSFGKITNYDTSTYQNGDLLWLDPNTAGGFTTTEPSPTDHAILLAAVTNAANNGTIQVRLSHKPDTDEVAEGSSNLYYTDARSRGAISVSGDLAYDSNTGVISFTETAETLTSIALNSNSLDYTDEAGNTTNIDLSAYLDEDSRAIASGTLNSSTGIVTFTRDDASTFTLDLSALLDDTNLVTSVNGASGVVVLDTDDVSEGSTNLYYTDTRADARIAAASVDDLSDVDISSTSPTSGDALVWDGSNFVPSAPFSQSDFDTAFSAKDTDDLSEGSTNLYYSDARVQAVSINNVVEDTTPQLGGDLDGNGNTIDLSSNSEAISLPSGTTAERPGTPNTGALRWNETEGSAEIYDGSDWGAVGGGVTDAPYAEHSNIITTTFTIASGNNAVSGGPITVDTGGSVTIPSGSTWTIV